MIGFRAIVRNVVRASFRNRVALIFTIGLAVFFMVIFGLLFTGNGPSLRVGVVDLDHTALSRSYVETLSGVRGLSVETGTLSDELDRLHKDSIVYVVAVDPGFASPGASSPATVSVYQSTNPTRTASVAANVVSSVTTAFAHSHGLGGTPGVVLKPQDVSTNGITAIDFFLPAMIAYIVLQSGINFVAIGLVTQRERKVLRRYLATPLRPVQILAGNIVGGGVTVLLQVVVLVALGMGAFGARTHGSWLLAALLILVGTATFVAIGFLLCSLARTGEAARGLAALVAFPMMFLSGVFIPLDSMPQLLQNIVHAFPLTYLTEALHAVLNDGDGVNATIAVDLAVMAAWAVGCFVIAAWRFRWE